MALQLNLEKLESAKKSLVLSLEKAGITKPPVMELCFILDVSGSFVAAHEPPNRHEPAITEQLIERLVPWGMTFDPDQKLDTITFSHRCEHVGSIDINNYTNFVAENVVGSAPWNGGTKYAPPLKQALQLFGYMYDGDENITVSQKGGFFGRLFGKTETPEPAPATSAKRKSLVIFVTDGENDDQAETTKVLADAEARGDQMYVIFLGINRIVGHFNYLKKLADRFKNVHFDHVSDYKEFVELPDDQLNERLITEELIDWMKA